ncbi:MAG: YhcN/YlaJ family sporulation lipoprotein [Eubacteriales bacterium]|nr:YhcN/YlaJ family sporulation lipoprotein [Eubacteriales bacterium]
MKKIWILLVISLMGLGLFTACASNADTMPSPSPSPSASPSMMPSTSPMATDTTAPTVSIAPSANAGVNTVEDAQRVSDEVSQEVEKLSELQSAEAIVAGTIAVVGVQYDTQYQGGLTDRLTEMVQARVEAMNKSVTTVHVKDDEATYQKLVDLRQKLANQDITFEQLQTQLLDLAGTDNNANAPAQG